MTDMLASIKAATAAIQAKTQHQPRVGIILGSGLSGLVDHITAADVVTYADIPGFALSSIPGHRGELVLGDLNGTTVVAMRGRFHFYEGYDMHQVTLPVRVMKALGCDTLIVTNAAGGLNAAWNVGDLMCINDHVFLPGMAGFHPLRGHNADELGPRFPAMLGAYDPELGSLAHAAAKRAGATLRDGVYCMLAGPAFETGAEMNFLRALGVDAVGMSTAPEVVVARHGGMRVLGISLITNIAHPDAPPANHEEVLEAGENAKPMFSALISDVVGQM